MSEHLKRFSFDPDAQKIIVHAGKVEIGQHIHDAFETIVANTLNVNKAHVRMSQVSTKNSPNDGLTAGSLSMQTTGLLLHDAALTLRTHLNEEASAKLNTNVNNIELDQNTLHYVAQDNHCSLFDLPTAMSAITTKAENNSQEHSSTMAASVTGDRQYIQDMVLPAMIHGRALRGRHCNVDSTDNVSMIKHGGFSAVVAKTEVALEQVWAQIEKEPLARDATCDGPVSHWIQQRRVNTQTAGDTSPINGSVFQSATRPFLLHASIAPSCAIALYSHSVLTIWTHSQGVFPLRDTMATHLGMPIDNVIVQHVPSAGCYGHNAADDAAMDAVLISLQYEGIPVRVVWTRQDDFQYSPVGAAMHLQIEAQLSSDRKINSWRQTIWSCPHAQRPGSGGNVNLLAAIEQDAKNQSGVINDLPIKTGGGASRNATPPYSIKSTGVTTHIVQDLPVRTSSLRGLGAQVNVIGIEAAIDQLASSCKTDPIEFRLMNLDDQRGREVLHQLRDTLDLANIDLADNESIGIAYSRYKDKAAYAAVAARVRLEEKVELLDVWAVVDAGNIVDRSGALNQIEGGIIQAASWTLCEGVLLRNGYIDAAGWEDYPILDWADIPNIHTTLIHDQIDQPYLGVGECMVGPVSAAIVNGVSHVAGCSMADLPLTPEKFVAASSMS